MSHQAKKSLGQNFLKSKVIVARIAKTAELKEGEVVIEIGPGKGILTRALLDTGAKVIAVEMDYLLIGFLKDKFKEEIENGKLFLIEGNILDFSVAEIFEKISATHHSYKLCANIPYYITGEIIRKFMEEKMQPENMTILVQKEVARRVVASDKKESILSISVKVYGEPKYIETVKRTMFSPSPNVDSAILHIKNISKQNFLENNIKEERFFKVVKKGFAHKRKKLSGNLKDIITPEILEKYRDARAEDLMLSDWINLAK